MNIRTRGVYGCAFSPDGSFVVSAGGDGTLSVWEPNAEDLRVALAGHTAEVLDCAVAPDRSIVSASWDGTVGIWDAGSASPRMMLRIGEGGVRVACCAVHPRGDYLVTSIGGEPLELRDLGTGERLRRFAQPLDGHKACSVSRDGTFIASGGDAGVIRIWDPATGTEDAVLQGHSGSIQDCAISPNGIFVVSASEDSTLRIWEVTTGRERGVLLGHSDMVMGCAISPDGAFVLSAGFDNKLKLWDATNCTEITEFSLTGRALSVAFHPSDLVAVCGDSHGALHRVELEGLGEMEPPREAEEELTRKLKQQLALGFSAIVMVAPEQISVVAQRIASLAAEAGYAPMVISGDTPPDQPSLDAAHKFVFIVELRGEVTDMTAKHLKHLADDFRSNREILVLPNGQRLHQRVDIYCSFVVMAHEDLKRGIDALRETIEYYAVLDTSRFN